MMSLFFAKDINSVDLYKQIKCIEAFDEFLVIMLNIYTVYMVRGNKKIYVVKFS